jgi:hypothetical protein
MIIKPKKTPRPANTYRQNGARAIAPNGRWRARANIFKDGSFKGPILLNRSRLWWRDRAKTYAEAREASPSSRPLR